MKLSHDNIQLVNDTAMLRAHVNILSIDSSDSEGKNMVPKSENVIRNLKDIERELVDEKLKNQVLEDRVAKMWQAFTEEQAKTRGLKHDLTENHKKIRMLSRGTKDHNQLLTMGQAPKANWGLGYNGKESTSTIFVHATKPLEEQVVTTERGTCSRSKNEKEKQVTVGEVKVKSTDNGKSVMGAEKEKEDTVVSPPANKCRGCFTCGKMGNKKGILL